jgi:YVTN family beta-propeller protein
LRGEFGVGAASWRPCRHQPILPETSLGDGMGDRPADGPAGEPAGIRTFLIADVRGYTLFTQERGDEAAAKLAARFAGIAREAVEEHGGSVIELRGDEALAVFTSARQAILAATRAQDRFLEETLADPTLPLPVGIGLDAGEAVPVEGGYRGGALNLAARLCGQAGPGEILASQGVIHLARKVDGVRTQDRGELHLKNLTEPVRVFRLISEESDPAIRFREFAPAPPKRAAAPIRLARAHPIIAIVVALALLAAIAVPAGLALRAGGAPVTIVGDALAIVGLDSGKLEGSVPLASRPGDIAVDASDGSVWVTLPDRGVVQQIDPETKSVRDTIPVGADPVGIAIGDGSIWVSNGGSSTVSRISPDTNSVVATIDVPGGPAGIAVDQHGVWVADSFNASVSQIDPVNGTVKTTIPVGDHPVDVAVDDHGVWVANAVSGSFSLIDPVSGTEVQQKSVGNGPQAIDAEPGGIWVANALDGTVSRIDPNTNTIGQTIQTGSSPNAVAYAGGSTWVSEGPEGSIAKIGSGSSSIDETIPLGSETGHVAAGDGVLWVSVEGSQAAHRGGTLTVQALDAGFDTLDPSIAALTPTWDMLALTNDGLVSFPRTGGLEGTTLVPDLAQSLPEPSPDGKTYTFHLRQGISYSNGEPARPEDFRRAIERVFSNLDANGDPSPGVAYMSGIVGAGACSPGSSCDLSKGIETDDAAGTVTFHLTEPEPDFLYRLALPFAFAVPADTPDRLGKGELVPATGPYVVERYPKGKEIVFGRNPAFVSWPTRPDGFPDTIVWRLGSDTRRMAADVLGGGADLMFASPDPHQFNQFAGNDAGQLHLTPAPATWFMSLNTQVAPFDNVDVRRALNFAVDRRRVQKLIGYDTTPTCQVMPPNFPGYAPYCPYTRSPGGVWTAQDLQKARKLVDRSGTAGKNVTVWSTPSFFASVGSYFVGLLNDLGYHATLKSVDIDSYRAALYGRPRQSQIAFSGWTTDYPAASGFIGALAGCTSPGNESGFCDPAIDQRMARAERLQITDPAKARDEWSSIEHDVMDEAPWVPLVDRNWANLTSERLGNFQVSPQYGPLVDQMWVQ